MKTFFLMLIICCLIGCKSEHKNLFICDSQNKTLIDTLLIDILKKYEINNGKQKVYQLIIQQNNFNISYLLRPINYYSQVLKDIPTSYFVLNQKVILVYSGLTTVYKVDSDYLYKLKIIIRSKLENDLLKDDRTINANYKYKIHDEAVWKIECYSDSISIDNDYRNLDPPPEPKSHITFPR